jgi:hypothetical protein
VTAPAPTAPLQQLLREIPQRFPTERIDRVWIFAPREMTGKESGLVVLSLTAAQASTETVPEVRHVITWHYEAVRARGGVRRTDAVTEQGSAPPDRIPRLIEGVIARLGEAAESPITESIGGDSGRWNEFLASLGAGPVDPPNKE